MNLFGTITRFLALIAVAAQPAVAMSSACCCTRAAEPPRACCQQAGEHSAPSRPACCSQPIDARMVLRLGDACGCLKAAPAIPAARETLSRPEVKGQAFALHPLSAWDAAVLVTDSRYLPDSPVRFTLSGPPLLALHCIWLK